MRQRRSYSRPLLASILALLVFSACTLPPDTNPERAANAAELEAEVANAKAQADQLVAFAEEAGADGVITETEASDLAALQESWEDAIRRAVEAEAGLATIDEERAREAIQQTGDTLSLFGVPLPPEVLAGVGGLGWLLFKRPRRHMAKALKNLNPFNGPMSPGSALAAAAKALGLIHSSEDPTELLEVAKRKAAEQNMSIESNGTDYVVVPNLTPTETSA